MNARKLAAVVTALALTSGFSLRADDTTKTVEKTEQTKTKTSAGTTKSKTHTVIGTVKEYEAGKKLTVALSGKKPRSFDLDDKGVAVVIAPDVAVGSRVKVVET